MSESGKGLDIKKVKLIRKVASVLARDVMTFGELASNSGIKLSELNAFLRYKRPKNKMDSQNFFRPLVDYIVLKLPRGILEKDLIEDIRKIAELRSNSAHNISLYQGFEELFNISMDGLPAIPGDFFGNYICYRFTYSGNHIARIGMSIEEHKELHIPIFENRYVNSENLERITVGTGCYLGSELYLVGHALPNTALKYFVLSNPTAGRFKHGMVMSFSADHQPLASNMVWIPVDAHEDLSFDEEEYYSSPTFFDVPLGIFKIENVEAEFAKLNMNETQVPKIGDLIRNTVDGNSVLKRRYVV